MNPPKMIDTSDVDPAELTGFAPAEIRRRLRSASVLIGAAELPTRQREEILRRARGHLGGTLRKLDRLIAEVCGAPVAFDEQLTERHEPARIEPFPPVPFRRKLSTDCSWSAVSIHSNPAGSQSSSCSAGSAL